MPFDRCTGGCGEQPHPFGATVGVVCRCGLASMTVRSGRISPAGTPSPAADRVSEESMRREWGTHVTRRRRPTKLGAPRGEAAHVRPADLGPNPTADLAGVEVEHECSVRRSPLAGG